MESLQNSLPAQKTSGKKLKKTAPLPTSDEEMEGGNSDAADLMNDEFDDLDVSDDDGPGLPDDFLGSDSGSDVYDSDDDHPKAMFSEDEDESDAEEKLTAANIAGLSRKLDEQQAEEAAEAQAELEEAAIQTNIAGDRLIFSTAMMKTESDPRPMLYDFSNLAEEGRSRAEYTAQLIKDICAYYGYSEFLAEKLFNLFPPKEAYAFFEANETPRPVVIRTNTLRTHRRDLAQALINRGVVLEPVGKWSKVGLQIFESAVPLGATPEYLAGHYILQAASSFLPVMALAPQENERVLDMASAPGGKTTHIAALMKNTGCIFANDSNKSRAKGLIGNIHRLGAKNVIVCNYDAREFPKVIGGFDRVLLDAPCSGTGVIAKDASVKTNKTERDFLMLPHLQKQLLLSAIDSVDHASKTGGYIVYSTCSVTVEENEQVVQYVLNRDQMLSLWKPVWLLMTRRYYPHAYNVDGFFVSKFKKTGPSPKSKPGEKEIEKEFDELDIDKTPIRETEEEDEFGGWDEGEDEEYIEKARKNTLKRKGIDPKADKAKAENKVEKTKKEETTKAGTTKKESKEKAKREEINKDETSKSDTSKKESKDKKKKGSKSK
ncbi:hypothetical protein DID88_006026 [Monilinia fructigena]|uniref:Nucleolar protein 2 n=1 Tax=Monilinia fructigena TaxID=38457 RepID=A0A395J1H6_9HELO|nr:hypothetical protein DID88_006026 [Monilinia fructigena]